MKKIILKDSEELILNFEEKTNTFTFTIKGKEPSIQVELTQSINGLGNIKLFSRPDV